MKKGLLTSLVFLYCSSAFAQAPDTMWTKTFGGSFIDHGRSVQQTIDGGYIIVGDTRNITGFSDVYLIKTDVYGDTLWTKTYGGSNYELGLSVQQTTDGGYIMTGLTESFSAGYSDLWLIKTDSYGDTIWTKTFGGSYYDEGYSVQQTTDGGYIVSGMTASFNLSGYSDVWLIKTNASGDILWTKIFGGSSVDWGNSCQQTQNGGYIIVGVTYSFTVNADVWLIKTDSSGDTLWTKTFGGIESDIGNSVYQTKDGGYIIGGYTESFGAGSDDVWFIKTDSSGEALWTKTYGGNFSDVGCSVQQTIDGGYIIVGRTASFGAGSDDAWLIKTDAFGDTLWTKTYGGSSNDWGYSVQQTTDNGYIITGSTDSYGSGSSDVWLIKTTPDISGIKPNTYLIPTNFSLSQNYPNPFNPNTKIIWKSPIGSWQTLKIYDVLGNEVATLVDEYKPAGSYEVEFNSSTGIRDLASGIYFYQLLVSDLQSKDGKAENYIETKKMILLK